MIKIAGARELLAEPEQPDGQEGKSAIEDAQDFLRQELAEGLTPVKTIKRAATDAGMGWKAIRRAADNLHVVKKKGGMADGWYWKLPAGSEKTESQESTGTMDESEE